MATNQDQAARIYVPQYRKSLAQYLMLRQHSEVH